MQSCDVFFGGNLQLVRIRSGNPDDAVSRNTRRTSAGGNVRPSRLIGKPKNASTLAIGGIIPVSSCNISIDAIGNFREAVRRLLVY